MLEWGRQASSPAMESARLAAGPLAGAAEGAAAAMGALSGAGADSAAGAGAVALYSSSSVRASAKDQDISVTSGDPSASHEAGSCQCI